MLRQMAAGNGVSWAPIAQCHSRTDSEPEASAASTARFSPLYMKSPSRRNILACVFALFLSACGDPAARQDGAGEPDSAGAQSSISDYETESAACGITSETTLTGNGLGDLTVESTVEDVAELCTILRDTTAMGIEGQPQRIVTVDASDRTVEAEIVDGKVWRIAVDDPTFRTSDSLGVGTALERLLEFPDAEPLIGEGTVFVGIPAHCGLSFRLSEPVSSLPAGKPDRSSLGELPQDTRVDRVLAFGCGGE